MSHLGSGRESLDIGQPRLLETGAVEIKDVRPLQSRGQVAKQRLEVGAIEGAPAAHDHALDVIPIADTIGNDLVKNQVFGGANSDRVSRDVDALRALDRLELVRKLGQHEIDRNAGGR